MHSPPTTINSPRQSCASSSQSFHLALKRVFVFAQLYIVYKLYLFLLAILRIILLPGRLEVLYLRHHSACITLWPSESLEVEDLVTGVPELNFIQRAVVLTFIGRVLVS